MKNTNIKISSVIENQVPEFIRVEYPLFIDFLKEYYNSVEAPFGPVDIIENISKYVKIDEIDNITDDLVLFHDVNQVTNQIVVYSPSNNTKGISNSYGLIAIDNEIILYKNIAFETITENNIEYDVIKLIDCVRGFSGVTSLDNTTKPDQLVFSESKAASHSSDKKTKKVENLSLIFFNKFLKKIKYQFLPGFEDREFYSDLNESLFLKQSKDFYSSKGTDSSFKILFKALYGKNVDVIKPRDFLIEPSRSDYRVVKSMVVESVEGNPLDLLNRTLYQDDFGFITPARGTVSAAETIYRAGKEYYSINIDDGYERDINFRGTIFSSFSIHPKSIVNNTITVGSNYIDVDSTVGFPNSGNLLIMVTNPITKLTTELKVTYKSKSLNQFFDCEGIIEDIFDGSIVYSDAYAYGYDSNGEKIKIRITGVLSNFNIPEQTYLFEKGNPIRVKTLGYDSLNPRDNNWFYNVPLTYTIESAQSQIASNNAYTINLYDEHSFVIGDKIIIDQLNVNGSVFQIVNSKSIAVRLDVSVNQDLYNCTITKKILKCSLKNYSELNIYNSNVQNTYIDDENSLYVASPSIPTYLDSELNVNDGSITGTFVFGKYANLDVDRSGFIDKTNADGSIDTSYFAVYATRPNGSISAVLKHNFYSGDAIVFRSLESGKSPIPDGIYYIKDFKPTDEFGLKLSKSPSNILAEKFVSPDEITQFYGTIQFLNFTNTDQQSPETYLLPQKIDSQRLLRKIADPQNVSIPYETLPGTFNGIFLNGVEILNYKDQNSIFYGEIESIDVVANGSGYDITNPPEVELDDVSGSGAVIYPSVIGGLEKINIIDPGFDFIDVPKITISGGNGYGAKADVILNTFEYETFFNPTSSAKKLNITNYTIGFTTYHGFRNYEKVIYNSGVEEPLSGLQQGSNYYVSVIDQFNIKLYNSKESAISGINTTRITSYGNGKHILKSAENKKKIGSIVVTDPGKNYQNKKTSTIPLNIDITTNSIKIKSHGYESGEIIVYSSSNQSIGGLTNNKSYYVTKINLDKIKLSEIGDGIEVKKDFYYKTKQYVNLTTPGIGTHYFNYEPITVNLESKLGIGTIGAENYNAVIQPIFRGSIQSAFIENGGSNYGNEEILNYIREPYLILKKGYNAEATAICDSTGRIIEIVIINQGIDYNSIPDIIISSPTGIGAVATPIIENGKLIEIKIIYGGINYKQSTTKIKIVSRGDGIKTKTKLKQWIVNLGFRSLNSQSVSNPREDGGYVTKGLNKDYGLQYSHIYLPQLLRESVYSYSKSDQKIYIDADSDFGSPKHSPIVGWAYDGNPIYGPYGYANGKNGLIKRMVSGYKRINISRTSGPSDLRYPLGFFVNDYIFDGNGDLDESNGRYCSTPDFPNGTYAYFCTLESQLNQTNLIPTFPYVIGNSFKSLPIDFNFSPNSNQDDVDINETKLIRNTHPYNLNQSNSKYKYIINPDKIRTQASRVKYASSGEVQDVTIINGGLNYKINDKIVFKNKNTFGNDASADITYIKGKDVVTVSSSTTSYSNIEYEKNNNTKYFIGFGTIPHGYKDSDLVSIVTPIERVIYKNIKVTENSLTITKNIEPIKVPITADQFLTYIELSGDLSYPKIRENDYYKVNNEIVRIINVDKKNSRVRVFREQLNTTGSGLSTHYSGSLFKELPRKFEVDLGIGSYYNLKSNYEYYFNPIESVGLGSIGPGIVSSFTVSNPGTGKTFITIPTGTIYLPNHGFKTNDRLVYFLNGGSSGIRVSTNNSTPFALQENQELYAIKVNEDLIGLSTTNVGLGTTGIVVKYGTNDPAQLSFTTVGFGTAHSFKTDLPEILRSSITKTTALVSTASTHGLSNKDSVDITVLPFNDKTVIVKYSDTYRVILIDPKSFLASDVNTLENTITISNHGYRTGNKIIYNSSNPIQGLTDDEIYYLVVIDSNKIALCENYYETTKDFPTFINFETSSSGTISPINPEIKVIKNQRIIFDLTDSSLSYSSGGSLSRNSSFFFNVYTDDKFRHEYISSKISTNFDVEKIGTIGVTNDAKLILTLNSGTPSNLYYQLVPVKGGNNPPQKLLITSDEEQLNNNRITCVESIYNGEYQIYDVTSTTFKYDLKNIPEKSLYRFSYSTISYNTNSLSAFGPIQKAKIKNKGKYFKELPIKTIIKTSTGSDALLYADTRNIGSIKNIELQDIGFDYPSDLSIRPSVKLPIIFKIDPLFSIDYIKIKFGGINYLTAPDIVVLDGRTNNVINDIILKYSLGDYYMSIIQNTRDLSNVTPRVIPTNNTNGIPITAARFHLPTLYTATGYNDEINITYNVAYVEIELKTQYSDINDFPFEIGDLVFLENIFVENNAKGFNSSNYGYAFFEVIDRDPNIGGAEATITLNWNNYYTEDLTAEDFIFNEEFSKSAKVVPIKYFPIYDVKLRKNNFALNEFVLNSNETSLGIVESWDSANDYLKVGVKKDFKNNSTIIGQNSKTKGIIIDILDFPCEYKVDSSSIVNQGWKDEKGFLNSSLQRLHDSDYYQYFSYALRSEIPYDKWNDPVSNLNHTAGFKKFSDLIIESQDKNNNGITTSQNNGGVFPLTDIISEIDIDCYTDFDLARELTVDIDGQIKSDEIIFNSRILEDYIESITNRALSLDDISNNFNNIPRTTAYSIINRSDPSKIRSKKYFIYIQDRKYSNTKEIIVVTTIHDDQSVFLTQYGRVETQYDLGYFDGEIIGTQWNLLFYPKLSDVNNYLLDYVTFDMTDTSEITQISLGDVCYIENQYSTVPFQTTAGSPITIVGIASTYRAAKSLIQVSTSDLRYFEYNEITMLHDDNGNVQSIEYGELTTSGLNPTHDVGLGTYWAHMDNTNENMLLEFIPNSDIEQDINFKTINVSIANTNYSTTDVFGFDTGQIESFVLDVPATPTPTPNLITYYDSQYKCMHVLATVEDPINKQYKVSEINIISDLGNSYITEYAIVDTNPEVGLGTFTTQLVSGETRLLFTPNPDTNAYIRGFNLSIGRF